MEENINWKLPLHGETLPPGISDNGGRRSGIERRKILIPEFDPERRSGQDRRRARERRTLFDPQRIHNLKRSMDRYMEYTNAHRGIAYAFLLSLPIWAGLILFFLVRLLF